MRRGLVAAGLLAVEYGIVTALSDLDAVAAAGGAFSLLAAKRDLALTLVLGVCFGLLLAPVISSVRSESRPVADRAVQADPKGAASRWSWAAHAGAFAAFATLSIALFGLKASSPPAGWVFWPWLLLGILSFLTLGWAILGPDFLTRKYLLPLPLGVALGGLSHLAGTMSQSLWDALSGATFHLALVFLRVMFPSASGDSVSRALGAGDFHVQVGAPCSGYEGLGVALVFFPAFLWLLRTRYRFPRALLILPLGLLGVWVGNAFRIAAIVALGVLGQPALAVGAFHSKIGWTVLTAVCLVIAAISLRVRWFTHEGAGQAETNPASAYLGPELILLAAALLTGLISDGHDPLYPLRVVVGGWALLFWFQKAGVRLRPVRATSVLAGALVGALWLLSARHAPEFQVAQALPASRLWLAMRLLGAVAIVPICEELAFRGYMMRRLVSANFQDVSYASVGPVPMILSSVAFGLVHSRPVAGALAGLIFAWLTRFGLGSAIWAHATANLVIGLWVLATGETWHW